MSFTGRGGELDQLNQALTAALDPAGNGQIDDRERMVIISAIAGVAGVGKTALAVHWAHRVAARFPDGQLYVNLRNYNPGAPMTAGMRWPGSWCAGGGRCGHPMDMDERAARYRAALAGRRVLSVPDNAATVEQPAPLLPGSSGAMAVVTSGDSLAGWWALTAPAGWTWTCCHPPMRWRCCAT